MALMTWPPWHECSGLWKTLKPRSSGCRKQTAAVLQRSAVLSLLPEACFPGFRPVLPAASITAPPDHAGDYRAFALRRHVIMLPTVLISARSQLGLNPGAQWVDQVVFGSPFTPF